MTSIIGDDERTTKDMDATLKGIPLTKNEVEKIFNEILSTSVGDGISFDIISIKDIRLEDEYGGFRLNILSKLSNNKTYITIELTTGDIITPREMKYNYNSIFENKKIPIMSYTLETVVAEKLQTIVTRGLLNTRLKDFYDIYILMNVKENDLNKDNLIVAIQNTFKKRQTNLDVEQINEILEELTNDRNMNSLWKEYVLKNPYAKDINFIDTLNALKKIIDILEKEMITI